jgi:hypothetical protein
MGRETLLNKEIYEGYYELGLRHGEGVITYPDGVKL